MRFVIFCIFICCSVPCEHITKIAHSYLKNPDTIIVYGNAIDAIPIRLDTIVTFSVDNIYWGELKTRQINIIYPYVKTPDVLDLEKKLVFIKRLSFSRNFEIIREFSSQDKLAPLKLKSLEKLLAIENLPSDIAKKQHFQYCLDGLKSDSLWQRWNGFWEWEYIVNERGREITKDMLQEILLVYPLISELSLKKRLRETIITTKRFLKQDITEDQEQIEESHSSENIIQAINKLKQENLKDQVDAIHIIGQYPGSISHDILIKNLSHSSPHIRALILFYLRSHANPKDIYIILDILRTDSSLRVRNNAIKILATIGAVEAIDDIKPYTQIEYTSRAAKKALNLLEYTQKNHYK